MSVTFIQPSMLGIIEKKATFWGPVANENILTCAESLTPAVAAFPTSVRIKPGAPVWLAGDGVTGFVLSTTPTHVFVGVAVGPSTPRGTVLVKMFGEATVILPEDTFAIGDILWHDGTSFKSGGAVPVSGIGRVTAKLAHPRDNEYKYRVMLRYGLPRGLKEFRRQHKAMQPGVLLSGMPTSSSGYIAATATLDLSAAGGISILNYPGHMRRGVLSASASPSGLVLSLRYSFSEAVGFVSLLDDDGTGNNQLGCIVSGNTAIVNGLGWVQGRPPANIRIQVNVQGIMSGRAL